MDGYHKLASLLSNHEDLFVLRRFATANVKNLLYMQAEILHLEAELHDIALEDHSGCAKHRNYQYCVFDLKESCGVGGSDTQWRKILQLREKLREYNDALLRYNQICKLPKANPGDLKFLRDWLDHDEGGHFFLQGREAVTWDPSHSEDIVSVSGVPTNKDALEYWICNYFIPWYHRILGYRVKQPQSDPEGNRLWVYNSSTIGVVAGSVSAVLAPLLPVISVFVLYLIQNPMTKLYAIIAFTTIFSLVLTAIARSSRIENFAATTA